MLDINSQHGFLFIWALVNPKEPHVKRTFYVVGTGKEIKNLSEFDFIKTVHFDAYNSPLVFHVFEKVR